MKDAVSGVRQTPKHGPKKRRVPRHKGSRTRGGEVETLAVFPNREALDSLDGAKASTLLEPIENDTQLSPRVGTPVLTLTSPQV